MQLWKERMRGIHCLGAAAIAGRWTPGLRVELVSIIGYCWDFGGCAVIAVGLYEELGFHQ